MYLQIKKFRFSFPRSSRLWVVGALLSINLPLPLWGQQVLYDPDTKKISYRAVVEVEGLSKEELYGRARKWFHESYIFLQSKTTPAEQQEQGYLTVDTGFYFHTAFHSGQMSYTCSVRVQDGKYRYEFSDFRFQPYRSISFQGFNTLVPARPPVGLEDPSLGINGRIIKETNRQVQFLIADLHQSLNRRTILSLNDW
jgi:hypothetical protein